MKYDRSDYLSILEVRQLSKVYGDKQAFQEVLKEINLDVDEGEFISIMGPSGSGKTTLLNVKYHASTISSKVR